MSVLVRLIIYIGLVINKNIASISVAGARPELEAGEGVTIFSKKKWLQNLFKTTHTFTTYLTSYNLQ